MIVCRWQKLLYYYPDIDECATGVHNCKSNERCVNEPGRFICKCADGYKSVNKTCEGTCRLGVLVVYFNLLTVYRYQWMW